MRGSKASAVRQGHSVEAMSMGIGDRIHQRSKRLLRASKKGAIVRARTPRPVAVLASKEPLNGCLFGTLLHGWRLAGNVPERACAIDRVR
jgi:hypothetical protein